MELPTPRTPAVDAMFTMQPAPRRCISGTTAREQKKTPFHVHGDDAVPHLLGHALEVAEVDEVGYRRRC